MRLCGLGQQLGHMAVIVRADRAKALWLAVECLAVMQIRVVVDLYERFEWHTQLLAITEDAAMVIRQAPRTGLMYSPGSNWQVCFAPPSSVYWSPPRSVQLRPPARPLYSSTCTL